MHSLNNLFLGENQPFINMSFNISWGNFSISIFTSNDKFYQLAQDHLGDYYSIGKYITGPIFFEIDIIERSISNLIPIFDKRGNKHLFDHDKIGLSFEDSGSRYLLFPKSKTVGILNKEKNKIVFVFDSNDIEDCWQNIRRTIRSVFTNAVESMGGIQLHAAGVSLNQKGIVILGKSGAGKTSLMTGLVLASKGDYEIISNDRINFWGSNKELLISGWPMGYFLGLGTIVSHEKLIKLLPHEYKSLHNVPRKFFLGEKQAKITIRVPEVSNVFETTISQKSELSIVLLPNINNDTFKIHEVGCDEVLKHFELSVLQEEANRELGNPENRDWLGLRRKGFSIKENKEVLFRMLEEKKIKGYAILGVPNWNKLHDFIYRILFNKN